MGNEKHNKIFNVIVIAFALLMIIGFILGTFLDLQTSQGIAFSDNIPCLIIAAISEYPAYGGLGLLGGALLCYSLKFISKTWKKVFAIILAIIATLVGVYYQGHVFFSDNALGRIWPQADKLYIALPIGLVLIAPAFYLGFRLMKHNDEKNMIYYILAGICLIGFVTVTGLIIKEFSHRPRYRSIDAVSGKSYGIPFLNWYESLSSYKDIIKQYGVSSTEFKSFPSMHTASAAVLAPILYIITKLNPKLESKTLLFVSLGLLWGIITAISRVMAGAHYLSDVSFGGIVFVFYCLIFYYLFKYWKNKQSFLKSITE